MEHKGGRSARYERHSGQENTPQAVIKRATSSFDLYSLIEGVSIGASKLASGNKVDLPFGRTVIDGIAQYLRSSDVIHKALYPQDVDLQEAQSGLMSMVTD